MTATLASAQEIPDFEQVVAVHGAAIGRVAAVHEKVKARRDELVQEILLAVWQALPRFKGDSSLKTFVLRIAHHKSVDHVLKSRHDSKHQAFDESLVEPSADTEQSVSLQQRAEQLLQAVQRMPLAQRELVALALEGCSHQEIAAIIGISANNVAVRLSRARQQLQHVMEP